MMGVTLLPRCTRGRSSVFWAGLIFVFFLALLPRLIYPVSRPMQWYERSVRFWDALLEGDLSGTYQRSHPGVTTMWVAGLGLRIYAAAYGWSGDQLLNPPPTPEGIRDYPVGAGVAALSIVIAVCIGLTYVLLACLTNWSVAFVAGCLLALDPFYTAKSRALHVDALLASFMLVSALFLIYYLQQRKRAHLIFSGLFAGLALLTKSPSLFLIPYAGLAVVFHHLVAKWHTSVESSKSFVWRKQLWGVACDLGMWALVAAFVFVFLWPAMWVEPGNALYNIMARLVFHAKTPHKNPNFFAGQIVYGDPGWLYYVAVLAWKTTLITLPASCMALLFLLQRRRRKEDTGPLWWMLIYASCFFLMTTLAAKKGPRYLLPTFLALDMLAAWGLVQMARAIGQWGRLRKSAWVPAAIITTALVAQAGTVLRHHPYYDTHHNLLLGGSRVAQHILPLGQQGEGLDLAAQFLNSYRGAEQRSAGLQERSVKLFQRHFVGHALPIEHPDVDYRVFAINSNQRELNIDRWREIWEACSQTEPLWSVSFDGVPYVWVCRAYPHDPQAFAIERRLDVQLGDHISLLGYKLSSSEISTGDALTVTLFWQSDGRVINDYHVFVHLLDAEEQLVAQHDGVPVRGERPAWSWRDGEIIQDEHLLITVPTLPADTYTLSAGMYDFTTEVRLPAVSLTGERLPEDRILLQEVQVAAP
jgi:hypothetical protein